MLANEIDNQVLNVRHFNRFHTKLVGALNEGLLASDFSLVQVRLMYELNHNDNLAASDLMDILKLDRGYLSRLIASLEEQNLISKTPDANNGKRMVLSLTDKGKHVEDQLEQLSSQQVADLIRPLPNTERRQLVRSMQHIEKLLSTEPAEPSYILRDPEPGDFGWIIHRHGVLYTEEQNWDISFEGVVAEIIAEYLKNYNPKRERAWVVEHAGSVAGSVFVTEGDQSVAKLRLLYVEPSARGLGIGARLVSECIKFARQKGYKRLTLWTHSVQESAGKIYRAQGFEMTNETEMDVFGQTLKRQNWQIEL
ncbi:MULTISPECIES: bifunctional helix-turn-helix transcriptional regulator/GNAT family N-acetyltransferase [unclassified Lentilitoribacter]|jgi:DNA-binding MarR family transcriptional regulator/GNAT superfamily N-acetyltransferase|uniref:bifunctional helix-turn-helix transcriptional regulator/GNAT family N-acetyltransferase n=1 Tax=unclassified Lentilitoribacter TaxID=2647570 RepID=UPI0013A6C900|nr:helix-turn-helix domain-containing GNAT family N-acetyltransferase [Lentilitoribacter sp. Alg239-R112]